MLVALAIGGVVLLTMIGVAWYGWVSLPGDALVPVHWGGRYNNFVSKRTGLVMYPALGVLIYLILAFRGLGAAAHGRSPRGPLDVILPAVLCLLLVTQAGAIRVARRRSGG